MAATAEAPGATVDDTTEFPYKFAIVPIEAMIVDFTYQRPLTAFHTRIVEKWDPALVGTLVVSERARMSNYIDAEGAARKVTLDNGVAVVDGQTRMAAAREKGIAGLPCLVYMGMTVAQEASLFARLQKERKGIASFHRFRAALVANEPEAKEIAVIVRDSGFEVGVDGQQPNEITAVAALEKVYRRGPEILERTLLILKEGWDEKKVPSGDVIRGMAHFLAENPDVDDEKMAARLSGVTSEKLKRDASALREIGGHGGTNDKHMGSAIAALYSRRGR